MPYVVGVNTYTDAIKEETLRAYVVVVGSRIHVQETHSSFVVGVGTATSQFADCQSADFESLVRATLPTDLVISV